MAGLLGSQNWAGNEHGFTARPDNRPRLTPQTIIQNWAQNTANATVSQCELGEACDDGACDPQATVSCASFEPQPCYDPNCAPNCELDGMDLACTEPHSVRNHQIDFGFSQQDPMDQFTDNQPLLYPPTSFSLPYSSQPELTIANTATPNTDFLTYDPPAYGQPCFHPEEHVSTGCTTIEPIDMHLNPSEDVRRLCERGNIDCCCNGNRNNPPSYGNQLSLPLQQTLTDRMEPFRFRSEPLTFGTAVADAEHTSTLQTALPLRSSPSSSKMMRETSGSSSGSDKPTCKWKNEMNVPCQYTFPNRAKLQEHVEQNHLPVGGRAGNKLNLMCRWPGCTHARMGRTFKILQHLRDHIRTHTGSKPYVCDFKEDDKVCGLAFGEKKALTTHLRTHTNEKPYKCRYCTKIFKHNATMKNHELLHENAPKKYKCPQCHHTDNDRANLTRHIDTHYPSRFSCKICKTPFSKKANANRHLINRSCKQYNDWPIDKSELANFIHTAEVSRPVIDFVALEIGNNSDDISVLYDDDSIVSDNDDNDNHDNDNDKIGNDENDYDQDDDGIHGMENQLSLPRFPGS